MLELPASAPRCCRPARSALRCATTCRSGPLRRSRTCRAPESSPTTYRGAGYGTQLITGIAHDKNEARITLTGLPDQPGTVAAIFAPLAEAGINVDMIVQSGAGHAAQRAPHLHRAARGARPRSAPSSRRRRPRSASSRSSPTPTSSRSASSASACAPMPASPRRCSRRSPSGRSTSSPSPPREIKVSVLIAEDYTELAVRVLHTAFGLDAGGGGMSGEGLIAEAARSPRIGRATRASSELMQRGTEFLGCDVAIMGGAMSWISRAQPRLGHLQRRRLRRDRLRRDDPRAARHRDRRDRRSAPTGRSASTSSPCTRS